MNTPTKTQIKEFVKRKLGTDPKWAQNALVKIYDFQTREEQQRQNTLIYNGVGFTGTDGKILSSFARQFLRHGALSQKQLELLMKKMPKYWIQIVKISNKEKLQSLINS
jgi:hypothetical protein